MPETRSSLSPLKEGITPGRRALAENLRTLFDDLDVSVRRYAIRLSYDYTTISRYLSGERVPAWEFIARLIDDVSEARKHPVTPETEQTLRRLHEQALLDSPKTHKIEQLKHSLAEADEETRRIKTAKDALAEALGVKEQRLAQVHRRCQALERDLQAQQRAHGRAVQVWSEQFESLQAERDHLAQEVSHLRQELAETHADLFSAEERCSRLEEQLEDLQELAAERPPVASLIQVLETTDRTATIPELVALVSGLETTTRQAVASEVVSSVTRHRTVREIVALLAGLYQAGFHRHAQAALPALVAARPLETAELIAELSVTGLDEPLATLLGAAVQLLAPVDIGRLACQLHHAGLQEQAAALAGAAATGRTVDEALDVIESVESSSVPELLSAALSAPAQHRTIPDLVNLLTALRQRGQDASADAMEHVLAASRSATDIADLLSALSWAGLSMDAEAVFRITQTRSTAHLVALVSALHSANLHDAAASVLTGVINTRPVSDIATVINDLYLAGHVQDAAEAITTMLQRRPGTAAALLQRLDDCTVGARTLLDLAASTASPSEAASLVNVLLDFGLSPAAEVVFERTVQGRPTGHAGAFLNCLDGQRPAYLDGIHLRHRVRSGTPTETAHLILALDSAQMPTHLELVLQAGCIERQPADVATLLACLNLVNKGSIANRSREIIGRVLLETVSRRSTSHQVELLSALEEVSMPQSALLLESIAGARARNPRSSEFRKALARRRRAHHPAWYSPAVFGKGPDPSAAGASTQRAT